MTFKIFKSAAAIALALGYSSLSIAQGGDDPIAGIDIILKRDPSSKPVADMSFQTDELKAVNSVKGLERPRYMAKIGAAYAQKATEGAQPKGGWTAVFEQALIKNWSAEEINDSTTILAKAGGQGYKVTFIIRAEGDIQGPDVKNYREYDAPSSARETTGENPSHLIEETRESGDLEISTNTPPAATRYEREKPKRPAPRIQRR